MQPLCLLALIAILLPLVAATPPPEKLIADLTSRVPDNMVRHDVQTELVTSGRNRGLKVVFGTSDWPNVYFVPQTGVWDWTGYAGLAVDVFNPEPDALQVCMRVDNEGADGANNCNQLCTSVSPGRWTTFRIRFNVAGDRALWGMRGLPVTGPKGSGAVLDLTRIVAFQVFLPRPSKPHTLILRNIRLYASSERDTKVRYPFVDRFGQYRNADWPGKLKSEEELRQRAARELAALKRMRGLMDLDPYGGWADGPTVRATGWFRTEKLGDRWWLVTPEGKLFFSIGVDCVRVGEHTFIDGRDGWFEWLPEPGSVFEKLIHVQGGVHSMAERIGGRGRVFSFYSANLIRKYGDDWRERWQERTVLRLRKWGFNTIGNWSDWGLMEAARIPFVASGSVASGVRRIEGGGGYWAKMIDVYDPAFPDAAERGLAPVARQFAGNKYCIGFFGDNEIAWDAVERGPLASPPDQPCRIAQVEMLQKKYGSLAKLNEAWGTSAASWDALRVPERPNARCRKDLDAFIYAFARRYFEVCKDVFRRHAPNHLYLGCRFAWASKPAVRACADVADVVSFNIYQREIRSSDWTGPNDLGKPVIIGEFHFGALDRGMFHEGLVPCVDQKERAASYAHYVRSVLECPAFVGCHWFQYLDEPITGRWFDGENYNIGFVDVTDTPYPELLAAARRIHAQAYRIRGGTARPASR